MKLISNRASETDRANEPNWTRGAGKAAQAGPEPRSPAAPPAPPAPARPASPVNYLDVDQFRIWMRMVERRLSLVLLCLFALTLLVIVLGLALLARVSG